MIVWEDWRNYLSSRNDIYLYNLTTNTEQRVTSDPNDQVSPAIDGDRIVWLDSRHFESWITNWAIYFYDLAANAESRVTGPDAIPYYDSFPDNKSVNISGDRIVWTDARNFQMGKEIISAEDIYLYDFSTSTERQITGWLPIRVELQHQYAPAISGDRIVWEDWRNGNLDIYLYDLATGMERQITTDRKDQVNPAISGDFIVWEDWRNSSSDIYLYDLVTNTEHRITTNLGADSFPAVSGKKIVWTRWNPSDDDSAWRIYMHEFNRPPDLTSIGDKTVNEGQLLTFTVSASDLDSDTLTYSASGLPSGAAFDTVTHVFSWTPSFSQSGNHAVTFTVSDGTLSDTETITITVVDVPNLLLNPDFEQDKQNWSFPANGSIDTAIFRSGTKSAKLVGTGTITSTPRVAVTAGKSYLVAGWVKTQDIANTATTAYGVRGRIQWYNASGALLSSQNLCGLKGTKDWARYSKTFTAPAGAVTARLQLQIVGSGTTGTAWFDSLAISP